MGVGMAGGGVWENGAINLKLLLIDRLMTKNIPRI
jgi:hypothetical protein